MKGVDSNDSQRIFGNYNQIAQVSIFGRNNSRESTEVIL